MGKFIAKKNLLLGFTTLEEPTKNYRLKIFIIKILTNCSIILSVTSNSSPHKSFCFAKLMLFFYTNKFFEIIFQKKFAFLPQFQKKSAEKRRICLL